MATPELAAAPLLEKLWRAADFTPNDQQRDAILTIDGPLFLPAGPGSGKTRVLLWRTVNLIACHGIAPSEIFLSTFTEKAAFQLRQGLDVLLGMASNETGASYDTSSMYVGHVHSLCRRILSDRRFADHRKRLQVPRILDELDQYFYLYDNWNELLQSSGFASHAALTAYLAGYSSNSRHVGVVETAKIFNRLSEESIDPALAKSRCRGDLRKVLRMYAAYREKLSGQPLSTDLSLLSTSDPVLIARANNRVVRAKQATADFDGHFDQGL